MDRAAKPFSNRRVLLKQLAQSVAAAEYRREQARGIASDWTKTIRQRKALLKKFRAQK